MHIPFQLISFSGARALRMMRLDESFRRGAITHTHHNDEDNDVDDDDDDDDDDEAPERLPHGSPTTLSCPMQPTLPSLSPIIQTNCARNSAHLGGVQVLPPWVPKP